MKILVMCQDYPSDKNKYAMSYVHTRNINYQFYGHEVYVLSFSAERSYSYQGVKVFSEKDLPKKEFSEAEVVLSHAPNLKNHVRLLLQIKNQQVVFFIHGHEVLKKYKDYPQEYPWKRSNKLKEFLHRAYDEIKISSLKYLFKIIGLRNDVKFVFVSKWMKQQFAKNVDFKFENKYISTIIPNASHNSFLTKSHRKIENCLGDFITIRPLDDSKYGVDLVVNFALANPCYQIHLYGKGNYFKHNEKPRNIVWHDCFIEQSEIPGLLDKYKAALMPTRYDSQGVMMCEMACYGIPLVTTDMEITKEMLLGFDNVYLLKESDFSKKFNIKVEEMIEEKRSTAKLRFDAKTLIGQEIQFFTDGQVN
ncbi:glycosyltransferase family 4 protein [Modicisalibacter xianhensis]|uniref:Glycosyltransferase involved in cell wall bisynthesis n=1 Tax=Modicisalibacter xianhensis TaxID=442341 RepID=A0A1I3C7N7_9GAMM|nr:glycosyltransferase family 4 protein [Halomonas xianhensis]SFH70336.1 Glycosyltransferase involved in cell wall bisynthesis [Halomonas xianhensis]